MENLPERKLNAQLQTQGAQRKTVASVLRSKEPTFHSLVLSGNENELVTLITMHSLKFIRLNFPGTQFMPDVAAEFAVNLISSKPDWRKDDIELFFKHTTANPPELSFTGNIITPMRLMELVISYENERSLEREKKYSEFKKSELEKKEAPESVKVHLEEIINKIKFLHEKSPAKVSNFVFFDPVKNEADRNKLLVNIPDYSDKMLEDIYSSYFTSLHVPIKDKPEHEFNIIVKSILKAIKEEIDNRKKLKDIKSK